MLNEVNTESVLHNVGRLDTGRPRNPDLKSADAKLNHLHLPTSGMAARTKKDELVAHENTWSAEVSSSLSCCSRTRHSNGGKQDGEMGTGVV